MIAGTLAHAARTMGGRLHGAAARFAGVSTDSRTLAPGELFFALRGPRFDAHDMLGEVTAAGAAGAVVERRSDDALAQIEVSDTRAALGPLAREWRSRFAIPLVGVTGSAGKTTVKEMLGAILRERGPALVTRGNLNNDIGVPLTLFGLGPEHAAAVVEMGCNRPGDIAALVAIARPTIGVITLAAPAHLEGLGDLETVARTKGAMVAGLPADGVAVINAEDAFAPLWAEMSAARRVVRFGSGGEVHAEDVVVGAEETAFRLCCPAGRAAVRLAYRGRHNVANALAATAAALAAGATLEEIARGLGAARPVGGRLAARRARGGAQVIDDSYNANPASLAAALDVLAATSGVRWLVLGDMGELGDAAADFHRDAGRAAHAAGVTRLFALGGLAACAAESFAGEAHCFTTHDALIEALAAALETHDGAPTVLVKGSRAMALERVVDALCEEDPQPC